MFEHLEMDFHPQVTVLIGENGAGKTALVEGVAKLLTPLPKLIEKIPSLTLDERNASTRKIFKSKDIALGKEELFCKISLSHSQSEELLVIESQRLKKEYIDTANQFIFHGESFLSDLRAKRASGLINSTPVIVYYRCEKTDDISQKGNPESLEESNVFNTYDNAFNDKSINFPSFLDWYKWQEDKELRGKGSFVLPRVREAMLSMLNDKNDDNRFSNLFIDVSSFKDYKLKVVKKDFELDFEQLSSGERSLLALVADIARRISIANPESKSPLTEGTGIVLIDEIDLHLHPRWQRKVIGRLTETFPKLQFIVTTHSPLILGSVRSENIRLLDDGQVFSVPETMGQSVGVIIKQIMGVEESLFEEEISRIFRLLARNKFEEARIEIDAIEKKSPADIPSLREAKAVLKRKEILIA